MIVLGIETSCDETSCAVVELDGKGEIKNISRKILSSSVISQDVHSLYGGVVPELASRAHLKFLPRVLEKSLRDAKISIKDIDIVSVVSEPGLPGSLIVGLNFAKGIAQALSKKIVTVNHIESHLLSGFLEHKFDFPFIGLVVSGGHTSLYLAESFGRYTLIAKTLDDAAGEVFDKVAKFFRLGYPGGPIIDKISKTVNKSKVEINFPKTTTSDFSFSGLKTAVIRAAESWTGVLPIFEFISSFQSRVIKELLERTFGAVDGYKIKNLAVTGGVARNSELRKEFSDTAEKKGVNLFIPSPSLCTDNAAQVAFVGGLYALENKFSELNADVKPTGILKAKGGIGIRIG